LQFGPHFASHCSAVRTGAGSITRHHYLKEHHHARFLSWPAIGLAAAFLVVATASFTASVVAWLAFAIGIATLIVSAGIAYHYRHAGASIATAAVSAMVSAWTIVASLVFSLPTVHDLTSASALAISGLALVGLIAHELSLEHAVESVKDGSGERETRLAAPPSTTLHRAAARRRSRRRAVADASVAGFVAGRHARISVRFDVVAPGCPAD
jgi:hypothetical protein